MNGITTTAGLPTGGGIGSKPVPERTEAKKSEPTPAMEMNWWDFYDIARTAQSQGDGE